MELWNINSWRKKLATQMPGYTSEAEVESIAETLSKFSPITSVAEIEKLRFLLAQAAEGKIFLIQSGDCAESFNDCSIEITAKKANHLLLMGEMITSVLNLPVVHVGRIAGQYAKPRSSEHEWHENDHIFSYKGDIVNSIQKSSTSRIPDPKLMLKAHACSLAIVDQLRMLSKDLSNEVFTSHEALLLYYEESLTRCVANKWYNLSTHFPWLGMRTAIQSPAHIEYLRGINNPIAIKIGPKMDGEKLIEVLEILDPNKISGRITLIHRLGPEISKLLPQIIKTVKKTQRKVLWCCDPMHANSEVLSNGFKIRKIENIRNELEFAIIIHKAEGSFLGGIHLEATHDDVKECISDKDEINDSFKRSYKSLLDPRLNFNQSLEIISFFAEKLKENIDVDHSKEKIDAY